MRKHYYQILNLKEKYNSHYLYFMNILFFSILKHGKKNLAWMIFSKILTLLKKRYKYYLSHFIFFNIVNRLLYSKIFLKTQHIGPIPYLLPLISIRKSIFLSKKWILEVIKLRKERTASLKIFSELVDVKKKIGLSYLKKFNYYKLMIQSKPNLRFLKFIKINRKVKYYKKKNFYFKKNVNFLKKK